MASNGSTIIQTVIGSTTTGNSLTVTIAPTQPYSLIVVSVAMSARTESINQPTDSQSGTYSSIATSSTNTTAGQYAMFMRTLANNLFPMLPVTTVTVTFTGTTETKSVIVREYGNWGFDEGTGVGGKGTDGSTGAFNGATLLPGINNVLSSSLNEIVVYGVNYASATATLAETSTGFNLASQTIVAGKIHGLADFFSVAHLDFSTVNLQGGGASGNWNATGILIFTKNQALIPSRLRPHPFSPGNQS